MTTLVTTIANTICVVTSAEDMNEAFDIHQAKVDAAVVGKFGAPEEACEWGTCYIKKEFITYINGEYNCEGYYTVQDLNYWTHDADNFQWVSRIKGIDYDVEDDLADSDLNMGRHLGWV